MSNKFSQRAEKAETQAKYWKFAAWTLPFAALGFLAFSFFLGFDNWYAKSVVITATVFFAVSVFWWWWALHRLVDVLKGLQAAEKGLEFIKHSMKEFRYFLRQTDDSDRERRD